ncbi:MAG TPA: hypothetical protein VMP08_26815 [Anaerolineae bacterium]|nr:hypothetical protein [Anaerolineae bacterium]
MKTRLMLAVLLLLTLFVAACQPQGAPVPQDPLEAVKTIADKQKDVKSQHVDLTMALNLKVDGLTGDQAQAAAFLKNFKANLNANGDVDNAAENFDLKGDLDIGPLTTMLTQGADKLTFEAVKVGDKMYTKANVGDSADKWNTTDAPKSTTEMTQTNPLSPDMIMSLLKQSSKADKLADEKIGDTDTYHYKVTMDPNALIDAVVSMAKTTDPNANVDDTQIAQAKQYLKDAVIEFELWAGKSDLLLRQIKVHFNLNLKDVPEMQGATAAIDFLLTNTASNVNQPVTITAPK